MNDINDDVWIWFKFQCMNIFGSPPPPPIFTSILDESYLGPQEKSEQKRQWIWFHQIQSIQIISAQLNCLWVGFKATPSIWFQQTIPWDYETGLRNHTNTKENDFIASPSETGEKKWWRRKNSRKHNALDNLKRMKINTMKRRKRANDRKQCVVIIAEQGPRIEIVWNLFSYNIKY